jgi:hypothetical protein
MPHTFAANINKHFFIMKKIFSPIVVALAGVMFSGCDFKHDAPHVIFTDVTELAFEWDLTPVTKSEINFTSELPWVASASEGWIVYPQSGEAGSILVSAHPNDHNLGESHKHGVITLLAENGHKVTISMKQAPAPQEMEINMVNVQDVLNLPWERAFTINISETPESGQNLTIDIPSFNTNKVPSVTFTFTNDVQGNLSFKSSNPATKSANSTYAGEVILIFEGDMTGKLIGDASITPSVFGLPVSKIKGAGSVIEGGDGGFYFGVDGENILADVRAMIATPVASFNKGVILMDDITGITSSLVIYTNHYVFDGNGYLLSGAVASNNVLVVRDAEGVTIKNFSVTNTLRNGISLINSLNVIIENVVAYDCGISNSPAPGGYGLIVNGSTVVFLKDFTSYGNVWGSINLGGNSGGYSRNLKPAIKVIAGDINISETPSIIGDYKSDGVLSMTVADFNHPGWIGDDTTPNFIFWNAQ